MKKETVLETTEGESPVSSGLGRPKLVEERVPFTTSLTQRNKKKLEVLASMREKRKADLLNEILAHYFSQCCDENEQTTLNSLD